MAIDFGFSPSLKMLQTDRAKSIVNAIANPILRNVCISGAVGTGKTFTILTVLHYLCMTRPGTKIAIARAEKTTLYSTLIPTFRKVLANGLRDCSHYELYGGEKRPQEIHYRNGSEILFTGADNDKIFGGEYSIIYLNELRLLDEVKYSDILGRLRGGGYASGALFDGIYDERYLLISDTNPGGPNSWIKVRERENRLLVIPTTLEDNPEYYQNGKLTKAGQEYKQVLLEAYGEYGWQFDRYVRGLWVAAEGAVWPSYNPLIHDIDFKFDDIPKNWKWSGAADYGVNHPAVYQLWATSPDRKRSWMFKEIYRTGLTEHRLAQEIKKLHADYGLKNVPIVGDTAGDGNQTLLDAGLMVRDANKKVLYGVDIVKQFFDGTGGREVRFNKKSLWNQKADGALLARGHPTQTTQEIPEYSYKPIEKQTSGSARDEIPDKSQGKDDGCDTLRYHLVDISTLIVGDIPLIHGSVTPEEAQTRWP